MVIHTPSSPAAASSGGSNQFKINPNTIQALHGMTDQQIREKLGKEVKVQIKDKNGNTIQTTAKVDVQPSSTETANHGDKKDVTINFDTYDGVATYHCNTANSSTQANDVILLNGGRYFHPDYFNEARRAKIPKGDYHVDVVLELCKNGKGIVSSVTALDVVSIQPDRLISILRQLKHRNRIQRLPVAALISPGESSDTIINWLSYGDDVRVLRKQIAERWIPVSSESLLELDDGEIIDDEITENASTPLRNSALELIRGWPVLAIYGSSDILARQGAELLEREVEAKTIKLEGGADCQEQVPHEFGRAVMRYLSDQLKNSAQTIRATNANGMRFSLQFATS